MEDRLRLFKRLLSYNEKFYERKFRVTITREDKEQMSIIFDDGVIYSSDIRDITQMLEACKVTSYWIETTTINNKVLPVIRIY